MARIPIAIEQGQKRTFATALDWPGWSRGGKDEASALEALVTYAPRYATVVAKPRLGFKAPKGVADLEVVERHKGGSGTDFGVPSEHLDDETTRLTPAQLSAGMRALDACRDAFDRAARAAKGKKLATGPRGGGRELAKVVIHTVEAEEAYAAAVGVRSSETASASVSDRMKAARKALDEAIAARERGDLPDTGPRGGERWRARHAIRRSAWHWLDHAWEIEDRISK